MMALLKSVFFMLFYAVWLMLLFSITCLAMLVTLDADVSIWWARRVWSPVLVWISGSKLIVEGQENVDPRRPTIYASNHQSSLDIPIMFMAIPANVRFVAKHQLRYVPMLGWYLWLAGHIFVDRARRASAIASLDAASEKIRSGTSIIVYPEGTRSPDGRILPFKKGSFALALKARVPICPITVEGSGQVMPRARWDVRTGLVIRVKIGRPMDTTRFADNDREGLMRAVRDVIIRQSLELGGKGGDPDDVVAAPGIEGIGRPEERPANNGMRSAS